MSTNVKTRWITAQWIRCASTPTEVSSVWQWSVLRWKTPRTSRRRQRKSTSSLFVLLFSRFWCLQQADPSLDSMNYSTTGFKCVRPAWSSSTDEVLQQNLFHKSKKATESLCVTVQKLGLVGFNLSATVAAGLGPIKRIWGVSWLSDSLLSEAFVLWAGWLSNNTRGAGEQTQQDEQKNAKLADEQGKPQTSHLKRQRLRSNDNDRAKRQTMSFTSMSPTSSLHPSLSSAPLTPTGPRLGLRFGFRLHSADRARGEKCLYSSGRVLNVFLFSQLSRNCVSNREDTAVGCDSPGHPATCCTCSSWAVHWTTLKVFTSYHTTGQYLHIITPTSQQLFKCRFDINFIWEKQLEQRRITFWPITWLTSTWAKVHFREFLLHREGFFISSSSNYWVLFVFLFT